MSPDETLFSSLKAIDFASWSQHLREVSQNAKTHLDPLLARLDTLIVQYGYTNLGLAVAAVPLSIILLTVLFQLLFPGDPTHPPVVFHWLPIIGSAIEYGNDPIAFFRKCQEKYGNVFTFILLGRKVTVALGPKGNNFILGGRHSQMNAEDAYCHFTTPVFGKDVVYDVPNSVFMEQKRFIKSGLTTDNFRAYVKMMEEEIYSFIENDPAFRIYQLSDERGEWGQFHPLNTISEITILTASRTLQGKEVRASLDKTFAQRYADLDGGFRPLNFMFPNLPLESYRKRDKAHKAMSDFYREMIRKRRGGKSFSDDNSHDMIAALLTQKYRDGHQIPEHEVAHIMIALLMAGQHTSAATGTWALLRIAEHPEIGAALYKEQVEHFGTDEPGVFRTVSYEELRALPLLDAVIRETLRLHSPIHSIFRKVTQDVPVPRSLSSPRSTVASRPYVVPKGHYVLACAAVSQRDPKIWPNAEKWDPYRWLEKDGVAAQAYKAYEDVNGEKVDYGFGAVSKGTDSPYQPFGAGRHRCIGEQFAYLQLGMLISTIIRKLELRLDIPFPEVNYHTLIVLPKEPCNISYRRRWEA
ncbi:ERG11_1 [Sanghuangporus sanghuang]|uniref:Lanosterol 14-alpha-demethylase n=1 Tax=Sanghuangporus baumii TaxID=108892 RepID=A0A9Q5HWN1_SANBA|nr:lanosterol 14-alpha-demethylase [Sanghuangporus baumii]